MSDEIEPDRAPEPPAVANDQYTSVPDEPLGFSPPPIFDDSAPLPYAGGTGIPVQSTSDGVPFEVQILGELTAIKIRLDSQSDKLNSIVGRIDWIAPRVEWTRDTFSKLIDQFGKITPGQVFSMLRGGKSALSQQEGKQS